MKIQINYKKTISKYFSDRVLFRTFRHEIKDKNNHYLLPSCLTIY
jgi:type II restriction/modification system DNA methylase subunit YeeA